MDVVRFTPAQGSLAEVAGWTSSLDGDAGIVPGTGAPHPETISIQAPASAEHINLLTTSPPTLVPCHGRPADKVRHTPPRLQHGISEHRSLWRRLRVSQGSSGYAGRMPGYTELDSARQRRDLSLALRRRLTVSVAVGATALTAVFMLVAAATAPGKATATPASGESQDPAPTTTPAVTQPAFNPPAQPPQSGFGGPPSVISGGS